MRECFEEEGEFQKQTTKQDIAMTHLSVNVNKIALLRNSRGRDFPNVVDVADKFCGLGVQGITVHPRQDERHIKVKDTYDLAEFLSDKPDIEFNIEGYPSERFLAIVQETQPDQCTLVPDNANQLTSDHGWDLIVHRREIAEIAARIRDFGVRVSLFLDADIAQVELAAETGVDRIELYTEAYAAAYASGRYESVWKQYREVALCSRRLGIGVNAGHDLDLNNLAKFLEIEDILEVSIGHALIVECIESGMAEVIEKYLAICRK